MNGLGLGVFWTETFRRCRSDKMVISCGQSVLDSNRREPLHGLTQLSAPNPPYSSHLPIRPIILLDCWFVTSQCRKGFCRLDAPSPVSWAIYSAQVKDRTVEQLTMCFNTKLPEGRQLRNEREFPSSPFHSHHSTASRAGLTLRWGTESITSSLDIPIQGRADVV